MRRTRSLVVAIIAMTAVCPLIDAHAGTRAPLSEKELRKKTDGLPPELLH